MNQIAKIKHVAGNVLKLAVRLTLRTIESVNGEIQHTDTDFIPSSDYPVVIQFKKKSFKLNFDATMHGSIAYIEDMGTIPVGTYDFSVLCKDDIGQPYCFKQRATLQVYEYTAEAGIDKDIEFEAKIWYLDSAIFLALKGEGGYEIPDGGIPMSDLSEEVRALLSKAETALQEHQSLVGFYTKDEIRTLLGGKVDKVEGKGLSTNDYTTEEKEKLAGLSPQVQADWDENDSSKPSFIQHKPTIPTAINGKSAYQVAVDNGFVGTEAQWLESLHGQDGKDGADGKDGVDGKDGTNGTNGINGQDGADGQDGKSAYQSYLDTTSDDPVKTEAQWVASLKDESVWLSLLETNTSLILSLATSVFNETDGSIIISDNASLPKAEIIETSTSITIQTL